MTAFRYRAVDLEGREIQGVLDADSSRQARSALRAQGLFALDVASLHAQADRVFAGRTPRLSATALMLLTRQWSTLLDAGIPVERALAALVEQSEEETTRALLSAIRAELQAGHPLHRALAAYPRSFDSLYCALVAAGEQSGQLDRVLARLADHLESRGALRQKLIQAVVYPLLVVFVASAVVMALMVYVVPQVVSVFQSGKQSLPLLTRGLIALSDFLHWSWPLLACLGFGVVWSLRRALREIGFRRAAHKRLMRLPVVGRLLTAMDSARLAQTLAILAGSGVPLLTALQAGGAVVWLVPLRDAVEQATVDVREGAALHKALAKAGRFPPLLVHMIASGESSGRLDAMLDKAAQQQADEVGNRLSLAMSLLEPLLILGMGAVVLVIVLAILQPIIEINQLIR
ncbi:type II secretion system inner membrane protein GspF [Azonexus sp. IMCC34839]|uniref:type II secretion system inner membrane protein GspF n=1 Tax=Azonexus sp. IMCC34839 TaxID=3133695 RepID=UPI00399BCE1C